jgi:hypothetical protein
MWKEAQSCNESRQFADEKIQIEYKNITITAVENILPIIIENNE